jgi:uncharacterized protein
MRVLKLTILLFLLSAQTFSQDVRVYEDFYENGKIYVRGFNIPVDSTSSSDTGLWTYWYENGNKLSEEIRNDPYLTKYINCWTGNGQQICTDGNGVFYQTWTDFNADSSVYTIKDSIKQGHYVSYLPYKKGYRKIAEGTFINGLRQGEVTYYFETGEILCKQTYLDNKENGLYTGYYKNGKIEEQGIEKENRRDSVWSFYNNHGTLLKKVTYKNYQTTYSVEFYPNGTIKAEGGFTKVKAPAEKNKTPAKKLHRGRTSTKRSGSKTVKNGIWIYYDSKGKTIKKENYAKGKLTQNGM